MHDDRDLVERRLDRAMEQRIRPALYAATAPLTVAVWHVPDEPHPDGAAGGPVAAEPRPVTDALAATYEPMPLGTRWGRPWSTSWFRVTGEVPAEFAGKRVEAVFDLGFGGGPGFSCEAMAYDAAGVPVKALHPLNRYVPVGNPVAGGERVDLLLEGAANPEISMGIEPTYLGDKLTAGDAPLYQLRQADVAVLDETVFGLIADVEVLSELMHELSVDNPRRHEILRALERMLDTLDLHDVAGTAAAGRAELVDVLSRPAHASAHRISAAGHAHIDSAWLWPLRETVRKSSRTFANVTALAEEYPELVFACSQAQQYAWVKDAQPAVFERIKRAVANGNWAPVGSMWVESDANLPGGEALVRQITHGKRFFADELGVDTRGIWLPDSFGYNASFPQIARLAGLDWFLTQKISWNQVNKMPHHTFWWEGIDGTRIFTHFPPADTYNGTFAGEELARAVRNYAEKGAGTISLLPFGHGDGGGGPTREMLEKARRLADLEGSAKVTVEHPDRFFDAAREEYPDAPVWRGEMYLELHRGTFTTQAKTKQGNRRSEHLLRTAELWATAAAVYSGADYPYAELDALWKTVLLHQFHDILPGSSIAWVHREARATYERIRSELAAIIESSAHSVGGGRGSESASERRTGESEPRLGGLRSFNAAPQDRAEVTAVPADLAAHTGLAADAVQKLSDGQVAAWASAPALGVGTVEPDLPSGDVAPVTVDGRVLSNGLVRVTVDDHGLVTSVYDLRADREVLAPGTYGNLLQLHPDHPNKWDAWDLDKHYQHRHTDLTEAESVEVVDRGPLLGAIRVVRRFGESTATQTLVLRAGSPRLDVRTEIDWRESEKVLKAAFPIDVHAERESAEIQFGHVQRPTHTNTSWDAARFEVYAHRWIHVAEPGYGVALVTDSTYGHDVHRATREEGGTTTTVRLTLLRAPHSPDPHTDIDTHTFTYSLVPGAGIGEAVAAGYALNLPLTVAAGTAAPDPLVRLDHPAVLAEAVKLADDGSGDVVVRLYESRGGRASTTVTAGFPVAAVTEVDLLERPLAELDAGEPLAFRPFQIRTLRLRRA
ncbi:alpha-mannosidase [Actinocatenispora rupis]|uniref:alpha-mannosidase n=1 Tax=Actinocatenispora rupis TaxID=519421 RepID=A0A8J3J3R9_9ACTN|nr:glycoside hydrolase family 38 C-terminal domain-containing protein [Actinocatenispora rupis]GID09612.1 alpha-mannosidase [Actinocatenispora rupis]